MESKGGLAKKAHGFPVVAFTDDRLHCPEAQDREIAG